MREIVCRRAQIGLTLVVEAADEAFTASDATSRDDWMAAVRIGGT